MIISYKTTLTQVIKEDVLISAETSAVITGIVNGNITCEKLSHLNLSGIVNGNINVLENSIIVISGVVNGTIANSGGQVRITGIVDNVNTIGGKTVIEKDSILGGQIQQDYQEYY